MSDLYIHTGQWYRSRHTLLRALRNSKYKDSLIGCPSRKWMLWRASPCLALRLSSQYLIMLWRSYDTEKNTLQSITMSERNKNVQPNSMSQWRHSLKEYYGLTKTLALLTMMSVMLITTEEKLIQLSVYNQNKLLTGMWLQWKSMGQNNDCLKVKKAKHIFC